MVHGAIATVIGMHMIPDAFIDTALGFVAILLCVAASAPACRQTHGSVPCRIGPSESRIRWLWPAS
jgi:hypothetical protein